MAFRCRYLGSRAEQFQDLFADIHGSHDEDFIRTRPWGNRGDRKNDGYLRSERTLFQVYGPNEMAESVFVNITLDRQEQAYLHAFEEAARKVPEVMECYLMSGEYDYLLRVVLADTADFERLHSQHLTRLPHVARVQSSFALRTVQKSRELPVR